MTRSILRTIAVSSIVLGATASFAQTPARYAGWRHGAGFYLWGASLDGTATAHGLDADIDAPFSDLWDALDFGAMLAYRGESEKWSVMADLIYLDLSSRKVIGNGGVTADVNATEWIVEGDYGYRFNEIYEVFAGLRYTSVDNEVFVTTPFGFSTQGDTKSWLDPVIGARAKWPIAKKWAIVARGDVGGFGVGADFTWQAIARADWQITPVFGVVFGYRILDVDYDEGSGADRFVWDTTMSGPLAAVTFTF